MATMEQRVDLGGGRKARRRVVTNRIAEAVALVAAALAIFVLAIVVFSVAQRGASELSWGFLTKPLPLFGTLLPRHLEIILEINRRLLDGVRLRHPGDDQRLRFDAVGRQP